MNNKKVVSAVIASISDDIPEFFGAISGSGTAAASAMGAIIGPVEEEEGYDKNFSDNVMGNGIYRNTSSYIRHNA